MVNLCQNIDVQSFILNIVHVVQKHGWRNTQGHVLVTGSFTQAVKAKTMNIIVVCAPCSKIRMERVLLTVRDWHCYNTLTLSLDNGVALSC